MRRRSRPLSSSLRWRAQRPLPNADSPWWQVSSSSAPARLQSGACEGPNTPQSLPQCGQIVVRAINLGDVPVSGSTTPVTITDALPAGLVAKGIARAYTSSGFVSTGFGPEDEGHGPMACSAAPPASAFPASGVTCTWSSSAALPPNEVLEVAIEVEVGSVVPGAENEVEISGGEGDACEAQEGGAYTTPFCSDASEGVAFGYQAENVSGSYEEHLNGRLVHSVSLKRPVAVGGTTPFGVEEYSLQNENVGGSFDTQAGSHPFQQTTNVAFNQGTPIGANDNSSFEQAPPALAKDLHFLWPAGLIGNTTALPQCTEPQFTAELTGGADLCPADAAVGVASVTVLLQHGVGLRTEEVPVFNLVPTRGEPARLGFEAEHATVTIDASVRTGSDYGVTVNVTNTTQLVVFIASRVTVWGVPGARIHAYSRGWGCMQEGALYKESSRDVAPCTAQAQSDPPAFLTLPTSCTGPLQTSVLADSWQEPENVLSYGPVTMPALDGCNKLPFSASLEVAPDVNSASTPTGLTVKVHVPQEASVAGEGLADSDVKDTTIVFPEGVTLNPSGANGLEGIAQEELIGFKGVEGETDQFSPTIGSPFCPDASKIGTVSITTPVLPADQPLKGSLYLASQNENPFGSLVANYIVAEDPISGVLVKLPGEVKLNPMTGRVEATFLNTPQAPFENLEVHLFGGERAPLSTPTRCGTYTTTASFTPWSGNAPVSSSSSFDITSGPNGSPCTYPGQALPFGPSLTGGTTNINAGGFRPAW